MYPFSPKLPSHSDCRITLSRVPVFYIRSLLVIHFQHSSVYLSIPNSLTILPPILPPPAVRSSFSVSLFLLCKSVHSYHHNSRVLSVRWPQLVGGDCRTFSSLQEVLLGSAGRSSPVGRSLGTRPDTCFLLSQQTDFHQKERSQISWSQGTSVRSQRGMCICFGEPQWRE